MVGQIYPTVLQLDKANSSDTEIRKREAIRNQYNQVPHLTKDTNGKVTNSQSDITDESQEVSTFPAGDHKATINRHAQKHNKHTTEITWMIHKRSTALERSGKNILLEGLNLFNGANLTLSSDMDQET